MEGGDARRHELTLQGTRRREQKHGVETRPSATHNNA